MLRFCAALWPFWWIHGHLSEGYALMESTLAAPAPLLEALRAQVHIGAGVLAYEQGRAQNAQQCCAAGLALTRQQGAPRACIIALQVLGRVACVTGDYLMARGYAEEALVFARQSGDAWDLTSALETLVKKDFALIDELMMNLRGGNKLYKQLPGMLKGTPTRQSTPIRVGNLSIGIEICKDHLEGARLRKYLIEETGWDPPAVKDGVDVQVITACGAPLQGCAIATKNKGWLFRVDGHPDGRCVPQIMCRSIMYGDQQFMSDTPGSKDYAPLSDDVLPAELQVSSTYDLSDPGTCSRYFIYNACPIETV
jgi:hypothetical protein